MLSPAEAWSVAKVAKMLFLGESTLRRRLQQESRSFRQIVEEVRMAYALGQLQSTSRPIGDIAQSSGYRDQTKPIHYLLTDQKPVSRKSESAGYS